MISGINVGKPGDGSVSEFSGHESGCGYAVDAPHCGVLRMLADEFARVNLGVTAE